MGRRKSRLTAGSPWPAPASGDTPKASPDSSASSSAPSYAPSVRAPRTAFVVSHTHWDREWYLTFSRFRVRLLDIVGKVLDTLEEDGAFRHFMLDGQAAILEDYLAMRPEDEGRIRALVTSGKLSIGPWYVLPDWFLVSAEAIVRNLLIGHQVCGRFGPVQKVGYMPDSFGHVAQIPQVLRRAGIDSFIFTRGIGDELEKIGYEFRWEAPDGSDVLAVNQHKGYDGAAALGFESYWAAHTRRTPNPALAVEQMRALFAGMAPLSRGDIALINNGGDHLPPQQEFGAILAALRGAFPETEFRHAGLAEYVRAVQLAGFATGRYSGELRAGKTQFILPGVWSARTYLKQLNDEAQNLLERYAEPVAAYLRFALGKPYPAGALREAWKLLLQNHPHDSICGCSTDDVHREIVPRFAGVIDTAEQLLADQMVDLVPTFAREPAGDGAIAFCVMNPLPEVRSEVVERLVIVPPSGIDLAGVEMVSDAGLPVPCEVVAAQWVERFWGIDYRTALFGDRQRAVFDGYREQFAGRMLRKRAEGEKNDQFLAIRFLAKNLPALGHATFYLRERAVVGAKRRSRVSVPAGGGRQAASLENEHVRVTLHVNGTFDLHHKPSSRSFEGLNLLESSEDVGDEYDYAPCPAPESHTTAEVTGVVSVVEGGKLLGRMEARFVFRLPAAIGADRKTRARRLVDCPVTVGITLRHNSPLVEVETVVDNQAKDHRLQARFPAGAATGTVVSDGHFYVNIRPVDIPLHAEWLQPPAGTHPQQEYSLVEDANGGLAVLARGLPEIAPLRDASGKAGFAVTLLRAVGWLSRDDLVTRRCRNAGPTIATPEAQCQGVQRFRYAVLPYAGDFLAADVPGWSARYRTPPLVVQGVEDGHVAGGSGLFSLTGDAVRVSAVKKHETRDTLVVRLCNLAGARREAALRFGPAVLGAWHTDLLEERLGDLMVGDAHSLVVELGPHEIGTVEVAFSGATGETSRIPS